MSSDHQFTSCNAEIWASEDFLDSGQPSPEKEDPWESGGSQSEPAGSTNHVETVSVAFNILSPFELSEAGIEWGDTARHAITTSNVEEDEEPDDSSLDTDDEWAKWRVLWEWDLAIPKGLTPSSSEEIDPSEPSTSGYPDPDPIAEFDPTLGTASYILVEEFRGLSRALKVDEWLASINQIGDHQKRQIADRLGAIGASQLRRWLPWLHLQEWTGEGLCLFLEFNDYWQQRRDWWEGAYWDGWLHIWRPTQSSSNLTLDEQLKLVRRRLGQPAHRVIDERWFEDWNEFSLWERGFPYFGKFALFRAGLATGEDWKTYIDWGIISYPEEDTSQYGSLINSEYGSLAWFYDSPVSQAPYTNLEW